MVPGDASKLVLGLGLASVALGNSEQLQVQGLENDRSGVLGLTGSAPGHEEHLVPLLDLVLGPPVAFFDMMGTFLPWNFARRYCLWA